MSSRLKRYLADVYEQRRVAHHPKKPLPKYPLQIDDQDDNDKLNEFCNIFCIVGTRDSFTIELSGTFPITQPIIDLIEIYNGRLNRQEGRISFDLTTRQVDVLMDLADRIRKTSFMGESVNNPNWLSLSSRTISSLYRFVRVIKEFDKSQGSGDLPGA
jgi:hypothetical protein